MDGHGWVVKLLTPAVTKAGRPTYIAVGVIETAGGPQLALAIGDSEEVILPGLESGGEHVANTRAAMAEKYRRDQEAGR